LEAKIEMRGIPIETLGIERDMRATWRPLLALLLLVLTGVPAAAIGSCTVIGPRYRLASDTVEWSMRVVGGQTCSRDFSLSRALSSAPDKLKIESVRLDSSPQSGHAAVEGSEFSYSAGADFRGNDSFVITVSGKINGIQGSSTIRISVSDASTSASPLRAVVTKHPPRGDYAIGSPKHMSTLTVASRGESDALKLGAGGYISGASIALDNTLIVRTDTYGAYIWNSSATVPQGNSTAYPDFAGGAWQQLVSSHSMPSACTSSGQQIYNSGVYEIAIAPSNSNHIFMVYFGCTGNTNVNIFRSMNKGQSWTGTTFGSTATLSYGFSGATTDPNASHRGWGPRMVVDPNTCSTANTCTVYAGMGTGGLWKTTDSGSTWTRLTNLPTPTANDPGITGIAVNPSDSSIVYASSFGNGVYESINGGSTWTQLTGGAGPGKGGVTYGVVSGNGNYFACDSSQNLWLWNGSIWTKEINGGNDTQNCKGIAVNPTNDNWIRVVSTFGNLAESTDGGTTWTRFSGNGASPTIVANDIPWLEPIGDGGSGYGLLWDAASPSTGKMILPTGRGLWVNTTAQGITSSTSATVYDQSIGIEQLVATQVMVPPKASAKPIMCSWDSPVFQPNFVQYPSTIYPVNDAQVVGCWDVDYVPASPVTQYVVDADGSYVFNNLNRSAICTIGGSCTLFSAIGSGLPANVYPKNSGAGGGNIAAADANHILLAGSGTAPEYTANGGISWTPISISGISSWRSFTMSPFGAKPTHLICADKVGTTTFYLNFGGSLYYSINGGSNWSLAAARSGSFASGAGSQMHCTPALGAGSTVGAGDLWIASNWSGSTGGQPVGGGVWHISAANTGSPKITACSNVKSVLDVGFGAPKTGNTYPSVYIAGWVGSTPVYGIWRSDDQCNTWTQIDTWPNNSLDLIQTISGDPNIWNKVYYGFAGSGYAVGQY
jgi:hypothetical protein